MSFSELPNELLCSIINGDLFPLMERIRLRAVCPRWLDVIEDGLKKETSLVIREDKSFFYPHPKHDDLVFQSGRLTDEVIRLLARLFPDTTQLTVVAPGWFNLNFRPIASGSKLHSLLTALGANCKSLKLYGDIDHSGQMEEVAEALNAMEALSSLSLNDKDMKDLFLLLQPTFSRLEKFSAPYTDWQLATMASVFLSSRCTHLMLNYDDFAFALMLLSDNFILSQLASSLTHLHLRLCNFTPWQYFYRLPGLTSLTLDLNYSVPLDSAMFQHFDSLTNLTEVKFFRLTSNAVPLVLPSEDAAPLPAIKRLTVQVDFGDSLFDYAHLFQAIRLWFPNLASFTLFACRATHSAIRASMGQLPFTVQLGDSESLNFLLPSW